MSYSPPPFPTGLAPGKATPSAKPLQRALKAAGYLKQSMLLDDTYGPNTQKAVALFYQSHPELSNTPNDTKIGPQGWARLHWEAYGGAEPPHNYHRTTYGGHTVNVRTLLMLNKVGSYTLAQGSYNKGVAASAGTHDGGGVVDVSVTGLSDSDRRALVLRLREAGFAAWLRTPAEGFSYHIHACAIGDREMAPLAKQQVQSYFNGRNGLANNGRDPVARPYPAWAKKYDL